MVRVAVLIRVSAALLAGGLPVLSSSSCHDGGSKECASLPKDYALVQSLARVVDRLRRESPEHSEAATTHAIEKAAEADTAENATADEATAAPNATAENATIPENSTNASNSTNGTCTTRNDPRAKAWWAETAANGTACVFGVDPRDEGRHCIPELDFGSSGWCYTKEDKSEWGSCEEACPLFGPPQVLGNRINKVNHEMSEVLQGLNSDANATGKSLGDLVDLAKEALKNATNASNGASNGTAADAKTDEPKGGEEKKAPTNEAKTAENTTAQPTAAPKNTAVDRKVPKKTAAPVKQASTSAPPAKGR